MKTNYPNKKSITIISSLLFLLFLSSTLFSQQVSSSKTSYLNSDPFSTAVFIKNDNIVANGTNEKILYHVGHGNIDAFFTPNSIIYELSTVNKEEMQERAKQSKAEGEKAGEEKEKGIPVMSSDIEMHWEGANPNPEVEEGAKSDGYYTYLQRTRTGYTTLKAYGYKTITYKNMYPGIDVVYSIPQTGFPEGWSSGMKYNLVVHPGADISMVKITYRGEAVKSIEKDKDGNVIVKTDYGNVVEHSPLSYLEDKSAVATQFDISERSIHFSFPKGYNSAATLTIDPWINVITSLPSTNMGFDVDYDLDGNTFVYGAGPSGILDVSDYFSAAKYSPNGTLLWQFNGSVPTIGWSSETAGSITSTSTYGSIILVTANINIPSNITIDYSTGNLYVGKAFDGSGAGTSTIRINGATGAYDNFVTNADPNWLEIWCFAYNCNNGDLLALGGGVPSDINMGVINTSTAAVTQTNITGITTPYTNANGTFYCQDILSGVYDNSGNLYVIMNSSTYPDAANSFTGGTPGSSTIPYQNTIYRVNNTYNGYVWAVNSHFTAFTEINNEAFWDASGSTAHGLNGNSYNALAANGSYLYYYDGYNLAAYSLATGAMVGTSYSFSTQNHTSLYQGGIAVDNCNHVYVGGIGNINTFTFNGSTFTPGTPISLAAQFSGHNIHDVKYNSGNNLLYFTGDGVVGTATATLSTACSTGQKFTAATSNTCTSGTVTITPIAGLSPSQFTYVWTNSSGTIVSQTNNTGSTSNTVNNLSSGTYIAQVQWKSNCGGYTTTDTVIVGGLDLSTSSTQSGCSSSTGTASVSVVGGTGSYTYKWNNNQTTASIGSLAAGTYTVTVTGSSCSATASVTVTAPGSPQLTTSADSASCGGTNGSATVSVVGGSGSYTYAWSYNNGSTATISNIPAGNYTVTVTGTSCSATASVTVPATGGTIPVTITANKTTMCPTDSAQLCVNGNFASYAWNTAATTQCTYVYSPGDYYATASNSGECSGQSNHITIKTYQLPPVQISAYGDTLVSYNAVSYQWFLNGNLISGATQSTYIAHQSGSYTVQVSDSNGCTETSTPSQITGIEAINGNEWVKVYPNPSTGGAWQLAVSQGLLGGRVEVYDDNGRLVYQSEIRNQVSALLFDAARGVYIMKLTSENASYNLKLIKLQ